MCTYVTFTCVNVTMAFLDKNRVIQIHKTSREKERFDLTLSILGAFSLMMEA